MKIFLYRIYSTTLSSYHAYDFTLKADFTKAITAQVSDMAHRPLVCVTSARVRGWEVSYAMRETLGPREGRTYI